MQSVGFAPTGSQERVSRRALGAALGLAGTLVGSGASTFARAVQDDTSNGQQPVPLPSYLDLPIIFDACAENLSAYDLLPMGPGDIAFDDDVLDLTSFLDSSSMADVPLSGGVAAFDFASPDPGNPAGTGFDRSVNVLIFETETTDKARQLRDLLLEPFTGRDDTVVFSQEETGVKNFPVYSITQPLSADDPDFLAHYDTGLMILHDSLVFQVYGVGFGAELTDAIFAAGAALRSAGRKHYTNRPLFGDFIVPHGARGGFSVGLVDGEHLLRLDEDPDQPISPFFGQGLATDQANLNYFVPLDDGVNLASSQSVWRMADADAMNDFIQSYPGILNELSDDIQRVFVDDVELYVPGNDRQIVSENAFIWSVPDGPRVGGVELLVASDSQLNSYGIFPTSELDTGMSVDEFFLTPERKEFSDAMTEALRLFFTESEVTDVAPPSIIPTMDRSSWNSAFGLLGSDG